MPFIAAASFDSRDAGCVMTQEGAATSENGKASDKPDITKKAPDDEYKDTVMLAARNPGWFYD